ncbi:hypothetical protein PJE062_1951 [Pseudovibrio sp. JE062]|nr:hypothetical protein PJE062_1951 [Pseudovibrio sp. JE062]
MLLNCKPHQQDTLPLIELRMVLLMVSKSSAITLNLLYSID